MGAEDPSPQIGSDRVSSVTRIVRAYVWPGVGLASDEVLRMDMLAVIFVLLVLLLASTWSFARSYFLNGRLAGMQEATQEIIGGIRAHYEGAAHPAPASLVKAVEAVGSTARSASDQNSIHRYQARLWVFGDAIGTACWRRGYDACRLQMTPAEGRIRIDLSPGELRHLTTLAHLGFQKAMPNDRDIELRRFGGEQHALEAAHAVERLEQAFPEQIRSLDRCASRRALIRNWWPAERKSA
jgi:hypothetical protein